MAAYGKGRKRKRRRSGGFAFFAVILMCAAIFVGLCAFLRVSDIEVVGSERYKTDELAEASGIENGDSMLLVQEASVKDGICRKFPYIENVEIKRELPNRIVIDITESRAVAYTVCEGAYWKLDRECRLLERTDAESVSGLISVSGAVPVSPSEGQTLSLGLDDSARADFLRELLGRICDNGLAGKVTEIDAENIARFGFVYGGRLSVLVGSCADLDAKFTMIMRILEDCAGAYGTIDVSDPTEGHFIPT